MTARTVTLIPSDDGKRGRGIDENDPVRSILNAYTLDGQLVATFDHHTNEGRIFVDGWHAAMRQEAL